MKYEQIIRVKFKENREWRDRLRERKFEEYLNFSGEERELFWKHMVTKVYTDSLKEWKWNNQWRNLNRNNFKKFKWFI